MHVVAGQDLVEKALHDDGNVYGIVTSSAGLAY